MKPIETRLNEVRYTTSDPHRMINRFIAKRVLRTWTEDYIDKDTCETASIERSVENPGSDDPLGQGRFDP